MALSCNRCGNPMPVDVSEPCVACDNLLRAYTSVPGTGVTHAEVASWERKAAKTETEILLGRIEELERRVTLLERARFALGDEDE